MSRMKWRVGDFGRFEVEDPNRPRFEVLGRQGCNVEVWYGGTTRPTLVPRDTFATDCTPLWAWERVYKPPWLKPGVTVVLHTRTHVLQAVTRQKLTGPKRQNHYVDITGSDLLVRRIHHDYASCMSGPLLVMVPVRQIADFGYRPLTALDRLIQDEDPLVEDDFSDIFG